MSIQVSMPMCLLPCSGSEAVREHEWRSSGGHRNWNELCDRLCSFDPERLPREGSVFLPIYHKRNNISLDYDAYIPLFVVVIHLSIGGKEDRLFPRYHDCVFARKDEEDRFCSFSSACTGRRWLLFCGVTSRLRFFRVRLYYWQEWSFFSWFICLEAQDNYNFITDATRKAVEYKREHYGYLTDQCNSKEIQYVIETVYSLKYKSETNSGAIPSAFTF